MDYLYKILPKDLVYIIDDYAKDRTKYTNIMNDLIYVVYRYQHVCFCHSCYNINHYSPFDILRGLREEKKKRFNDWYDDIKKLKKPHGKQLATIKSNRVKKRRIGKNRK